MIEQASSAKQVAFFYLSKSMIAFFKSTLSMENLFSSINEKEAQCDWERNMEL